MDFDLNGYLEREPLALTRPQLPLFEAVVNAIKAVEDSRQADRHVKIHVDRDMSQMNFEEDYPRGTKPMDPSNPSLSLAKH